MKSSELYRASKSVSVSTKAEAETALSNARKTVQDLTLKIEESNSRAKFMRQKQHKVSLKNKEDYQYAQVVKEVEHIRDELGKLKLDMAHVLNEKRHADNTFEASSAKRSTPMSVMERIRKEIEELDEEHVLVELARIEAVKEQEIIEAQRKEKANHHQTQLDEVRNKVNNVKQIDQHDELPKELQLTFHRVNLLENELAWAKGTKGSSSLLQTITEELETSKAELESIKREGFNLITSMDVIRNELKHVREKKSHLEKEEEKRNLKLQIINSKILKGRARLESVTATTEKVSTVASNISLTVEQLRAETEVTKKEKKLIVDEIEKLKLEISKSESELKLSEERLEAMMEELKTTKSSEASVLEKLKNLIDSTVRARESTSLNSSTIMISNFEYEYLTRKAIGAEEIADKKVAAAQAWMEAIKANEKEILMKIKMAKKEIREASLEVDENGEGAYGTELGSRRTVDVELNRWGQNGAKVFASPRRSMYKVGNMTLGRRARSQKLISPANLSSN